MLRILNVHSGNLFGGIETMMLAMTRHRALCPEMIPSFALCFRGRLARELAGLGEVIHDLGEVKIRRPDSVWRARRRLAGLLRERRFDVMATHSSWSQVVFGPVIRKAGVALVNYLHGAANGTHWLERLARRTPPDLVIANSRYTASTASSLYPNTPCEMTYYPMFPQVNNLIRNDVRARIRAELQTDAAATVVVQVSRMEAWKGHILLLQALSQIRHLPGWVCWQVGGPHRPQEARYFDGLKDLAVRLGIADRVRFTNERNDVPSLLASADIHCQPNTGPEPFGLTFIEALMAGLPVVTTAMGGALEIVDASCGVLTPPGDSSALALVLKQLIDNPGLRHQLGDAGPARARLIGDARVQLERTRDLCQTLMPRGAP